MNMLEQTLILVRESDVSVADIARRANVGKRWMQMVLSGHIADPSVRKIQRVFDLLASDDGGANADHLRADTGRAQIDDDVNVRTDAA